MLLVLFASQTSLFSDRAAIAEELTLNKQIAVSQKSMPILWPLFASSFLTALLQWGVLPTMGYIGGDSHVPLNDHHTFYVSCCARCSFLASACRVWPHTRFSCATCHPPPAQFLLFMVGDGLGRCYLGVLQAVCPARLSAGSMFCARTWLLLLPAAVLVAVLIAVSVHRSLASYRLVLALVACVGLFTGAVWANTMYRLARFGVRAQPCCLCVRVCPRV